MKGCLRNSLWRLFNSMWRKEITSEKPAHITNEWLGDRSTLKTSKQNSSRHTHTALPSRTDGHSKSLAPSPPPIIFSPSLMLSFTQATIKLLRQLCFRHRIVPRGLHVSCSPVFKLKIWERYAAPLSQDMGGWQKANRHISVSHLYIVVTVTTQFISYFGAGPGSPLAWVGS